MCKFNCEDLEFLAALRNVVGNNNVYCEAADTQPFLEDWRGYKAGEAVAVVFPSSTEEVSQLVHIARHYQRAVVPQGGNTGLCQGAVPSSDGKGIIINLRRMNNVREIDTLSGVITADAGITLSELHAAAEQVERRIPLSVGSEGTAQLGGLASTNAGGTSALRYGPIREMICGLEVALPDGTVFSDLKALRKNNTGYDLRNLFIGSEGTLGIITAVALRMQPLLRTTAHAWLVLRDLQTAAIILSALQEKFDTALQTAELLSATQVELVLKHIPRTRLPFENIPEWSLLIELGSTDVGVELNSYLEDWLVEKFNSGDIIDCIIAQNEAQAKEIWHIRHSVSEANKIHGHSLSHDIVVRPSRVPELIHKAGLAIRDLYPQASILIVSHIGDGNVHFIVHFTHDEWASFSNPDDVTRAVMACVHDIVDLLDGSFSAEHGIGRKLVDELILRIDPVKMHLMKQIKQMFDPENRFNPDAVLGPR